VADALNLSMFRAYDIRTPSSLLTDELAVRLARAEARYFREVLGVAGVVVAHDARMTGPRYLSLATEAYLDAGLDVVAVPCVSSTCLLYFTAMKHPHHAAVMFGASHNPRDDTGQKILGANLQPIARDIGPEGGLEKIKELYLAVGSCRAARRGRLTGCDALGEYVDYSSSLAGVGPGSLAGLRVLHDYLNGAAGREMMIAFERAGVELTPLHFAADGTFPLGDPNPVKEPVTREGRERLQLGAFDLATFFDGDGDRLDFYVGDGTYLASSFIYAAVLPLLRDRFPGDHWGVFADLKSSPLAIMELARAGVRVEVIRNGHSQIKQSMIDDPTMFGTVEESAHFYEAFRCDNSGSRFCTENSLYVALLVARAFHEQPDRIRHLLETQATTSREREWGYRFPSDQARAEAMDAVEAHFTSLGAAAMKTMSNGMDLEATMLRRGLPFRISPNARLADDWLQVCQRISQSENGLARWEVVGADTQLVGAAKADIARIVRDYGAGEEYQG
jgi:phosphomannomutase